MTFGEKRRSKGGKEDKIRVPRPWFSPVSTLQRAVRAALVAPGRYETWPMELTPLGLLTANVRLQGGFMTVDSSGEL